jgi:hypothetical protein
MSSTFTIGFGSILKSSPDGTTYAEMAQTVDLDSPETEVGKVKITNNDSPNNSQEYRPGIQDPQAADYKVVYKSATFATLETARLAGTILYWKEIFPDGSGLTWQGYVVKNKITGKTENEALMGEFTVQPITVPTYQASGLS